MKKSWILLAALALGAVLTVQTLLAHCQIPCGIFDDAARFKQIDEHITTIEKSMKLIVELSADKDHPNYNQLIRWVNNKETHADELTEIVTYYFMAQRVKPAPAGDKAAQAKYVEQLTLLHQMIVHAMKAKQNTELEHIEAMRKLLKEFEASYMAK